MLQSPLRAGRLVLASVFLMAGYSKAINNPLTRATLAQFAVSSKIVPSLAVALPIAELAVGASLLIGRTAKLGAFSTLVLLAIFTGGIVNNMKQAHASDCGCFGEVWRTPVGKTLMARNLVLGVLALLVFLQDEPGVPLTQS